MNMYCRNCVDKNEVALANIHDKRFCGRCGEPLREELIAEGGEIFIKALPEDRVAASNFHLGCGGCTDEIPTSVLNKSVHVCRLCYCRIYAK